MTITSITRATVVATLVAGVIAGCGDDEQSPGQTTPPATTSAPSPSSTTTSTPESGTREAIVYLLRDEKIAPVLRQWDKPTTGVAAAAIRALLDGPAGDEQSSGLSTAIPEGTELNAISIADGLATVDLSGQFASGGGSASMSARVAQVVATLTRFPTVQRVAFRLDGKAAQMIGGEGVAVDPPIGRVEIEEQTPQILVESPVPGAAASSPLRVTGTANTFEATFILEILDGEGKQLGKQVVTATSGSGTRGTFDVKLPFKASSTSEIELYAYEASAEDGSAIHEVHVPLRAG